MDPSRLIPAAEPIPVASGWLVLLGVLTLVLHLLVMNVVLGGSLIALVGRFRGRGAADAFHAPLVPVLPTAFALAINLGVAPLLFLQVLYGHFFYSSSVLMAVFWILVIPVLILAYYGAYVHARRAARGAGLATFSLTLSALALLYVAFAFVNNMTMMERPDRWTEYFANRGGTLLNLGDPTFWPRLLHMLTGATAIAALFLALLWSRRARGGAVDARARVRTAGRLFAWVTLVQIAIGIWFLMALPRDTMLLFMGGSPLGTAALWGGVLVALAAVGLAQSGRIGWAVIGGAGAVALMTIAREVVKVSTIGAYFRIGDLAVKPQYDVFILFLVVFVIGLACVGWMLRAAFPGGAKEGAR